MSSGNEKYQAVGAVPASQFHSPDFKNYSTIFLPSARTLFMHKPLHRGGSLRNTLTVRVAKMSSAKFPRRMLPDLSKRLFSQHMAFKLVVNLNFITSCTRTNNSRVENATYLINKNYSNLMIINITY